MHPEVRLENPGNCPKCGMALEDVVDTAPEIRTQYVCPMHPEIIRSEPGSCPKCGMALEPRDVSGEEEENHELTDMSRRFWVSTALSVPVFILAMAHDLMPELSPGAFFTHKLQWFEICLGYTGRLVGGWPFFQRGWRSVINRNLNMFTLIALGISVAWGYSVAATVAPGIFRRPCATRTAWWPFISRLLLSLRLWCCWDKYWNCGLEAAPARLSKCCWNWHRKQRAG